MMHLYSLAGQRQTAAPPAAMRCRWLRPAGAWGRPVLYQPGGLLPGASPDKRGPVLSGRERGWRYGAPARTVGAFGAAPRVTLVHAGKSSTAAVLAASAAGTSPA